MMFEAYTFDEWIELGEFYICAYTPRLADNLAWHRFGDFWNDKLTILKIDVRDIIS
jgi:hypothetical protein